MPSARRSLPSLTELAPPAASPHRGTDGCTHLNDALRALAEVPVLVAELTAAGTDGHQAGTA